MTTQTFFAVVACTLAFASSGCSIKTDFPKEQRDPLVASPDLQDLKIDLGERTSKNHATIPTITVDEKSFAYKITPTETVNVEMDWAGEPIFGATCRNLYASFALIDQGSAQQIFLGSKFTLQSGKQYTIILSLKGLTSCTELDYTFMISRI